MKKYTVTLNKPFDRNIRAKFETAGVICKYNTELNPHLIFVEAENIEVLTDLEFVANAKKSGIFTLNI